MTKSETNSASEDDEGTILGTAYRAMTSSEAARHAAWAAARNPAAPPRYASWQRAFRPLWRARPRVGSVNFL